MRYFSLQVPSWKGAMSKEGKVTFIVLPGDTVTSHSQDIPCLYQILATMLFSGGAKSQLKSITPLGAVIEPPETETINRS